jgi:hypothetical protein
MKRWPLRLPRGGRLLLGAAGAGFLASLIAAAPASLAAAIAERAAPQLDIAGSKGGLWRGEFRGVIYDGVPIGDVAIAINPLALPLGRLAARVESRGGALAGKGRIALSFGSVELHDVSAMFALSAIRRYTFFGARYEGAARIDADRLLLSRRGCAADGAKISTNALDGLSRRWSGRAFPLAGDIRCAEGRLVLTLSGDGADGAATLQATVAPDLSYGLVFTAAPRRREAAEALRLFGFQGEGETLSYEAVGRLKGLRS